MALVSVVIPTCNRGQFLGLALESVLAQTFSDFEVVVVDDGGTPGSTAAIERCRDSRLRLLRHPQRRGGAAARNSAIAASSAPYVAFLDDDDEWYPDKLARQVELLNRSPDHVGVVYTGYHIVQGERICGQQIPAQSGNLATALLTENLIGGSSSVMLRRSALAAVGGFDETLSSFQDYDLWLRLARRCHFECIAAPLLKYRMHGAQIWTNAGALSQGLDAMLRKYGSSAGFRRQSSVYFVSFGVRYCRDRQLKLGQQAFRRAAELEPLRLRPYVFLGASLLGSGAVEAVLGVKSKLRAGLRRLKVRHA